MQNTTRCLLQYTWSWYDDNDEEISPVFDTQDAALDWFENVFQQEEIQSS